VNPSFRHYQVRKMKAIVNKRDVRRTFKNLDLLEKEVSHFSGIAAKLAADDYASLVRSGIGVESTPPFVGRPWPPLSEAWKKAKIAHEEKFWIETGGILKAVKTKIIRKFLLYHEVFAGIMRIDDDEAFERALRNEYGFGLGSARPLFGPAIEFFTTKRGDFRKIKRNTLVWARFKAVTIKSIRKVYGR